MILEIRLHCPLSCETKTSNNALCTKGSVRQFTPNYKWRQYCWAVLSLKKQGVSNSQGTETADSLFQGSLQRSINCLINAAWCRKLNWRELILGKHIPLAGEPLPVKLTAFGNAAAFVLGRKICETRYKDIMDSWHPEQYPSTGRGGFTLRIYGHSWTPVARVLKYACPHLEPNCRKPWFFYYAITKLKSKEQSSCRLWDCADWLINWWICEIMWMLM